MREILMDLSEGLENVSNLLQKEVTRLEGAIKQSYTIPNFDEYTLRDLRNALRELGGLQERLSSISGDMESISQEYQE